MRRFASLVLAGIFVTAAAGPVAADRTEMGAMIEVIEDVVEVFDSEDPLSSLRIALIAKGRLADMDVSPECIEVWAGFYALALAVEARSTLLLGDIDAIGEERAAAVFDLLYVPSDELQQPMDACTAA